jgi:hypothetical protein
MISQDETIETKKSWSLADRREFMKLSLEERRRILAEQAAKAASHYDSGTEAEESRNWQGGDIVEY